MLLGPPGRARARCCGPSPASTGIDHGRIALHGRDVTHVRARDRGVGLVFQNYALFRHMTVADNIEFALRVRRMKRNDRVARRKELLKLVALEGMDERLPGQLSGGQQQRVAVARALAHKPQVLLLDEPFGALDAKIREELRRTIREVQRELGITTVLVTHDQEEAFALADTIGVMNHGRLLEVGNPNDLYAQPATRFVATFLGAANLLLARQSVDGIRFGATPVSAASAEPLQGGREHEVVAVLRPEEVELGATREALTSDFIARGAVEEIVFTGALERLRVRLLDEPCAAQLLGSGSGATTDPLVEVTRTQPERRALPLRAGAQISLGARRLHVLPTPISSFLACAPTEAEAAELAKETLLEGLSTRMKTRVGVRAIDGLSGTPVPFAGVAAIAAGSQAGETVEVPAAQRRRRSAGAAEERTESHARVHPLDRRSGAPRHPGGVRQPVASRDRRGRVSRHRPRGRRGFARHADAQTAGRALRSAADAWPGDAHRTRHRRDGHRDHAQPVHRQCADAGAGHQRHHAGGHGVSVTAGGAAWLAGAHRVPPAGAWPRPPVASQHRRGLEMRNAGKREPNVIPGFGITLGFTTFFLCAIVLLPLSALVLKAAGMDFARFVDVITSPRAIASYKLSFGASMIAAAVNMVFGFAIAWTLVRYDFPGRKFVDAIIDMPFALPTAVSGIALTTVFAANGWIGHYLESIGIQVAYTWIGITVALTLIGMPFVVRTVQPALAEVQRDLEDAAETLGAGRFYVFRRIIVPTVLPALLTGFTLAFARGVGEYGSVIFISGNMPMKTEITPLLIVIRLEEFDYAGAAALGCVLLAISFVMLLAINLLQVWGRKRMMVSR